jgi:hypothetical protein
MSGSHPLFQTRIVTLDALKEAVKEGKLKKRYKVSRYQLLVDGFKKSKDVSWEVSDLTNSQLTQLQNTLTKSLGKGKATVRTISKKGEGKEALYTVWVIKVGPQTKDLLEA